MSSLDKWQSYSKRQNHLLIGIMSGTSLDGVDAALVQIQTGLSGEIEKVTLQGFEYVPYSIELKEKIIALCAIESATLDEWVLAHFGLSEWYAFTVDKLLLAAGIQASEVDAICMHGQTIWHAPEKKLFPGPNGDLWVRSTLQIGEISVLRERTGIPVIGNLRARDVAAGGEGAPLAPYFDAILFGDKHKGRIIQNIGGIGNATVMPPGATFEQIFAYDTGPGNMVMDTLVREATDGKEQYDRGGVIAASGHVDSELLESFMQDPYYLRKPPKSTGREVYGTSFAEQFRQAGMLRNLSLEDLVATATALTAVSIVKSYEDFVFPAVEITDVIVCGGGAHNATLMQMMKDRLPKHVNLTTTSEFGIPNDAREAVAFAVLGHESLMGRPSNLPSVTGASKSVILGNISM